MTKEKVGAVRDNELSETRCRILDVARQLFSLHGFEGASIRKIAEECKVNLAAIHYHFQNKENLFWEIIAKSYEDAEALCLEIEGRANTLEEYAVEAFDTFRNRGDLVRNTMKLLLTDKMEPPQDSKIAEKMKCSLGPPGANFIVNYLNREVPYELSPMGQMWGVKMIFGTIIHWTQMSSTAHYKSLCEANPLLEPNQIREDIIQLVRATLSHLKQNPQVFGAK